MRKKQKVIKIKAIIVRMFKINKKKIILKKKNQIMLKNQLIYTINIFLFGKRLLIADSKIMLVI